MNIFRNILFLLEIYNTLIKYHIKADSENQSGERRIDIHLDNLPDLAVFRADILQKLEGRDYDENFINEINRLYQLSQSNSDLVALNSFIVQQLYKNCPATKELEQLSFGIFEFINNEIFEACDEYERPVIYKGFEDIRTGIPEYWFKDDNSILWNTCYLLNNLVDASVKQKRIDINNQKEFLAQEDIPPYIREQQRNLIEEITSLSQDFCDRNFVFSCLQGKKQVEKEFLTGYILSDVLSILKAADYAQYIELDYSQYPANYNWQFEKKSLKDYPELFALPHFKSLVSLLIDIFLYQGLENKELEDNQKNNESDNVAEEKVDDIPSEAEHIDISTDTGKEKEKKAETPLLSPDEDLSFLQESIDPFNTGVFLRAKPVKDIPTGYILPVPILDLIYKEFDDELWNDITLVEFLNMFTTEINKVDSFKLKAKQTTRFYYLLKKIWLNSSNKTLFNTEKEWIVPFLQNYNLSYSAYTNQFIKKEGGLKHQKYTRAVDKILPKDEIE